MKYMSAHNGEDEIEPCLIIHCSPAAVMASDAYQSWMSKSVVLYCLCNCNCTGVFLSKLFNE